MIRVFKHYIPHAVLLLGLFDLLLLVTAGEVAWRLRAGQIDMDPGFFHERLWSHAGFAAMMLTAIYVCVGATVHSRIVMLAGTLEPVLNDPRRETIVRRVLSVLLALVALWFAWTTAR